MGRTTRFFESVQQGKWGLVGHPSLVDQRPAVDRAACRTDGHHAVRA